MNKKLITALFVLLLTPALLYAARPSVSAQEQALNILVDALVVCPPNSPTRFVDNGDGTICDHQTGLMWEKKVSDVSNPSNPNSVNNNYAWTSTSGGIEPDGTAFTDFLARLNGEIAGAAPSEQLSSYRDWRVPTSAELQTIVDCSFGSPCIDTIFGPTAEVSYWTSTTNASDQTFAWVVLFNSGDLTNTPKNSSVVRVRAVRGGR